MSRMQMPYDRELSLYLSYKDFTVCVIVSVLVTILSITNQSIWIDEGVTVWLASYPTFGELLFHQLSNTAGETQNHLPFYIWYMWGWVKIFGISELSLRLANAPFLILLISTIRWGCKVLYNGDWNWSIMLICPFIWFYMNEARPYVAVMAFSSLAFICFFVYLFKQSEKIRIIPWLSLIGIFFASGMVSFNILLVPLFLVAMLIQYKFNSDKWKIFLKDWLRPILILMPLFILLGAWFAWAVIKQPSGDVIGTNLKYIKNPGILNILFSMYEFFGFQGLGPPRNLMRSNPTLSTFLTYAFPLSIGIIGWISISILLIKNLYHGLSRRLVVLMTVFYSGIILILLVCYVFHFRFWGRHLAMLYPIFLLIIIGFMNDYSSMYKKMFNKRLTLCLLIVIWSLSSLRLAYMSEYKKDEYRSAVSCAINAAGNTGNILWAANRACGQYYGLSFVDEMPSERLYREKRSFRANVSPNAIQAVDLTAGELHNLFKHLNNPVIIVISKPDLHDKSGTLIRAVNTGNAQLIASPNDFKIYKLSI